MLVGSKSQAPQCLKQQSQHFLGFMVFAFTMPAGILFASCSAAAVPAEDSGDSGFITLLDPDDGNSSSIVYYPPASCGAGVGCCHPIPAHTIHRVPSSGTVGLEQQLCRGSTRPLLGGEASSAVPSVGRSTQLCTGTGTIPEPGQAGAAVSHQGDAETWMWPSTRSRDAQGW